MANLQPPLETLVEKIQAFRKRQMTNALKDNHLDPQEREEMALTDAILDFAIETNDRKRLGEHIERGGDPSAYMNSMAHRIGMKITHLEEYRQRGRVVAFPHSDHSAG